MQQNIKHRIVRNCVLQHDSSDCGAACLVSVIRYFGGNTTIEKIRILSGTTQFGSSMLGLYQAARENNLDVTGYEADIQSIIGYKDILILHISKEENLEHFVICFGFVKDYFLIWDPSSGLLYMTREELDLVWKSKKCLSVSPDLDFKTVNVKAEKLHWLVDTLRPEKDLLLISILIGILVSGLGLVMAIYTQKLIDQILPHRQLDYLIYTGLLVLILLSTRIVLAFIRQTLLLTQGKAFNIRVVDDFYRSFFSLPKLFFDNRKTGDFVARLNDTMRIQKVIADLAGVYLIDILVIIVTVASVFCYSVGAGLLTLICLPCFYFIISRNNDRLKSYQNSMMQGYSVNESNFIDTLKGITEIKSNDWNELFIARNKSIYSDFQDKNLQLGRLKIKLNLLVGLFGSCFLVLILTYSAVEVITMKISQGEMMAILSLSSTLLPSAINVSLIDIPLSEAKTAINRMFEFTLMKREELETVAMHPEMKIRRLELRNISFRYPGQGMLLDNINLCIQQGEVASLIGENGSGKSTLANILLRFYSPESGQMLINNEQDSAEISLKDWRSKIGYVPQEVHIFNGTILENLVSDYTESKIKEVISVITDYNLEGLFQGFPNGLLTLVGEEGINLSGGQKQLIAYMRALIRKPDILVIDEGTSNMDIKTEGLIIEILSRLKETAGILMITHRMNILKRLSAYIYVLSGKTILNSGDHNTLLNTDSFYKNYWKNSEGM